MKCARQTARFGARMPNWPALLDNLSADSLVTKQNAAEELFRRPRDHLCGLCRRRLDRAANPF
jgi:hypothetical protein